MSVTPPFDEYLGDGVYATFDGFHIRLDLRAQDDTTRIALEPSVLDALDEYRGRLPALVAQHEKANPTLKRVY